MRSDAFVALAALALAGCLAPEFHVAGTGGGGQPASGDAESVVASGAGASASSATGSGGTGATSGSTGAGGVMSSDAGAPSLCDVPECFAHFTVGGSDTCYCLHVGTNGWDQAHALCTSINLDLAALTSPQELNNVSLTLSFTGQQDVWLGGRYNEALRSFTWTTNEVWNADSWGAWTMGDPTAPTADDCVLLGYESGRFEQVSCAEVRNFLCESTR